MITQFKIFESVNKPIYKKGDIVYQVNAKGVVSDKKSKIIKVLMGTKIGSPVNRYILDRYPNLSVREDYLLPEHEVDAKKYNL